MNEFLQWFATSKIASMLRVAVAFIAAQLVADFVKVGDFDFSNWKAWVIGALAVALPMFLRWLNPADTSFNAKG